MGKIINFTEYLRKEEKDSWDQHFSNTDFDNSVDVQIILTVVWNMLYEHAQHKLKVENFIKMAPHYDNLRDWMIELKQVYPSLLRAEAKRLNGSSTQDLKIKELEEKVIELNTLLKMKS